VSVFVAGVILIVLMRGVRFVAKYSHWLRQLGVYAHAKVFISFFTVVTTVEAQFGIPWPAGLEVFFGWLGFLSFDLGIFTGFFCLANLNLYQSLLCTTLPVLACIAVLLALSYASHNIERRSSYLAICTLLVGMHHTLGDASKSAPYFAKLTTVST
jgi:hypothetical protein